MEEVEFINIVRFVNGAALVGEDFFSVFQHSRDGVVLIIMFEKLEESFCDDSLPDVKVLFALCFGDFINRACS